MRPQVYQFGEKVRWLLSDGQTGELESLKSQKSLAEYLGVAANQLNQWMKGKFNPPIDVIVNLARLYGFGPSDSYIAERGGAISEHVRDEWFSGEWRCWFDPDRTGNQSKDVPDDIATFATAYSQAIAKRTLHHFKPYQQQPVRQHAATEESSEEPSPVVQRFLAKLLGIDLKVGTQKPDTSCPLFISVTAGGMMELEDEVVGISAVDVHVRFADCTIHTKEPPYKSRPGTGRDGVVLQCNTCRVLARGSMERPVWTFKSLDENMPLDGEYITENPPACDVVKHSANWSITAEAYIGPSHIRLFPMSDNVNKARLVDRVKSLILFHKNSELLIKSVTRDRINED